MYIYIYIHDVISAKNFYPRVDRWIIYHRGKLISGVIKSLLNRKSG